MRSGFEHLKAQRRDNAVPRVVYFAEIIPVQLIRNSLQIIARKERRVTEDPAVRCAEQLQLCRIIGNTQAQCRDTRILLQAYRNLDRIADICRNGINDNSRAGRVCCSRFGRHDDRALRRPERDLLHVHVEGRALVENDSDRKHAFRMFQHLKSDYRSRAAAGVVHFAEIVPVQRIRICGQIVARRKGRCTENPAVLRAEQRQLAVICDVQAQCGNAGIVLKINRNSRLPACAYLHGTRSDDRRILCRAGKGDTAALSHERNLLHICIEGRLRIDQC